MTADDLPMLHEWLARPHVVRWWGGEEARLASLDDSRAAFLPETLAAEGVTPYIAMRGDEAVGYAQSYVALGSGDGWWDDETDPGVHGVDQFLADPDQLGRGLGSAVARALGDLLFTDPDVTKVQADPSPDNARAIRCYEKAGFRRIRTIATPDGPAVYMVRTRQP